MGIYPPGCAVVLANGEVSVVLKRTRHASGPVVKALRSPRGQNYEDGPKRLTSEPFFKIERIADFGKLNIAVQPERWWSTVVASGMPGAQALAPTRARCKPLPANHARGQGGHFRTSKVPAITVSAPLDPPACKLRSPGR